MLSNVFEHDIGFLKAGSIICLFLQLLQFSVWSQNLGQSWWLWNCTWFEIEVSCKFRIFSGFQKMFGCSWDTPSRLILTNMPLLFPLCFGFCSLVSSFSFSLDFHCPRQWTCEKGPPLSFCSSLSQGSQSWVLVSGTTGTLPIQLKAPVFHRKQLRSSSWVRKSYRLSLPFAVLCPLISDSFQLLMSW